MENIPAYQLFKLEIERDAAVDKFRALFYKLNGPLKSSFDKKTTINPFLHAETFRNAHCKNAVFYDLVKDAKCCPLECPQEDTLNNCAICSLIVLLPTPKKIQCTKKYSVEKKVGCLTLEDSVIRDAIVTQHSGQLMLIIFKVTTNIQLICLLKTQDIQVYDATDRVGDLTPLPWLQSHDITYEFEVDTMYGKHADATFSLSDLSGQRHYWNLVIYMNIPILKINKLGDELLINGMQNHLHLKWSSSTVSMAIAILTALAKAKNSAPRKLSTTQFSPLSNLNIPLSTDSQPEPMQHVNFDFTKMYKFHSHKYDDILTKWELETLTMESEILLPSVQQVREVSLKNIYLYLTKWELETLTMESETSFRSVEQVREVPLKNIYLCFSGQPIGGGHGCNYLSRLGKANEWADPLYSMIDKTASLDTFLSAFRGRFSKKILGQFLSPVNGARDCLSMGYDLNVLQIKMEQFLFPCVVSWLSECSLELVTTDSNKLDKNLLWGLVSLPIKNVSLFCCLESDYNNTHVSSVKQFISEKAISGENYVNNRSKANDYVNGECEILSGIPEQSDSDVKGSWEDSKELHIDSLHTVQAEIVTSVAKQQPYRIVLADHSKLNTAIDRPELDIAPETYMVKSANLIKLTRENETSHAMIVPIDNTVTIHSRSKTNVSLSEEEFYHLVDPQSSLYSDKSVLMNSRELLWLPSLPLPVPQMDITVAIMQASTQAPQFPELMTILQQLADGEPVSAHVTMRYELLRVCTLKNYPKKGKIYLTLLAGAGFYYAGDVDELICYCCGVRRRNWTAQEKPRAVHVRLTPLCKFLKDNKTVNVPVPIQNHEKFSKIDAIPDLPRHELVNQQAPEDVSNDHVRAGSRTTAEAQGAQTAAASLTPAAHSSTSGAFAAQIPKYPQYATRAARLATYQGWPMETSCPRSEQLSEAGFFYAGVGDCVRCFFCGIGLRHWTEDDDPWVEHARFGKTCLYLRKKKGEEFIREIQQAYERRSNGVDVKNTSESNHPEDVMARHLLSDAAQSVLGMGYQPSIIKQGIQALISGELGDRKFSAQELMEKILDIEEAAKASASSPPTGNAASTRPTSSRPPLVVGAAPVSCGVAAGNATAVDTQPTAIVSDGNKMDSKKEAGKTAQTKKRETTKINFKGSNATDKMTGKQLREENERLREQSQCRVCLNNPTNTVFLPCGHLVTCTDCAAALRNCPICRTLIKGTVKTYAD